MEQSTNPTTPALPQPLVSVIMPVYNVGKFISQAIESIINQTYQNLELIIIDDQSTDNTLNIIRYYQTIDSRIQLIRCTERHGNSAARNQGLAIARGQFIAAMDGDDVSLPHRIETEVNFLLNHSDIFLVGSYTINIDEVGTKVSELHTRTHYSKVAKRQPILNCIYHPTIMYRNEGQIRYRDKFIYAADTDLYLRLLSSGKRITNITDRLVRYRLRKSAISQSKTYIQAAFAKLAISYYWQREIAGKDSYQRLDSMDFINRTITAGISQSLGIGDTAAVRKLYIASLEGGTLVNQYLPYFLAALLPTVVFKHAAQLISFFNNSRSSKLRLDISALS